jgi:hypothetical protein
MTPRIKKAEINQTEDQSIVLNLFDEMVPRGGMAHIDSKSCYFNYLRPRRDRALYHNLVPDKEVLSGGRKTALVRSPDLPTFVFRDTNERSGCQRNVANRELGF